MALPRVLAVVCVFSCCAAEAAQDARRFTTFPGYAQEPELTAWQLWLRSTQRRIAVHGYAIARSVAALTRTHAPTRRDRRMQSSLPTWPGACNVTYDSQDSFSAQTEYAIANSDCMNAFAACMSASSGQTCDRDCTADIDVLQNACDNTYCEVTGSNNAPTNPNIPPFSLRYAVCVPDGCDASQHDALQAYFRGFACGALYTDPDCSINLSCAYDLSSNTIWIIVGSIAGFFGLVLIVLGTWWACERRKAYLRDLAEGEGQGGEEDTEYDELIAEAERGQEPSAPRNTSGFTYVDMRGRGGNDAIINDGQDGL